MKNWFLFLSVILNFSLFGQIRSKVLDEETKEPIPYVNIWVKGKSEGATSDVN